MFALNAFSPDRQWKSDSVRINLRRCSVAAGNKPLPVTNRACHFWLSVRLLVFHVCSSGSFAASEIIICKDEGLSGEATGLWEQPFYLLFSATAYFFLLQSFHLSFLHLAYSAPFHHIYLFDLLFIKHISCFSSSAQLTVLMQICRHSGFTDNAVLSNKWINK